mmetsp:Transcript_16430/g.48934  ORF Transcript_16430/g.48934 Transcript_16430/m.48934 type:complete len:204 (+) Transcript_16430:609-1220(+)
MQMQPACVLACSFRPVNRMRRRTTDCATHNARLPKRVRAWHSKEERLHLATSKGASPPKKTHASGGCQGTSASSVAQVCVHWAAAKARPFIMRPRRLARSYSKQLARRGRSYIMQPPARPYIQHAAGEARPSIMRRQTASALSPAGWRDRRCATGRRACCRTRCGRLGTSAQCRRCKTRGRRPRAPAAGTRTSPRRVAARPAQ